MEHAWKRGKTHRTVKFVKGEVLQVHETTLSDPATGTRSSECSRFSSPQMKKIRTRLLTPPQVGTAGRDDLELSDGAADEGGEGG